jgi:hypothetical protein
MELEKEIELLKQRLDRVEHSIKIIDNAFQRMLVEKYKLEE